MANAIKRKKENFRKYSTITLLHQNSFARTPSSTQLPDGKGRWVIISTAQIMNWTPDSDRKDKNLGRKQPNIVAEMSFPKSKLASIR